MSIDDRYEPKYQDEVKNMHNETCGVVIAKYYIDGVNYIDVRDGGERVYYHTPASRWAVVHTREELEGID